MSLTHVSSAIASTQPLPLPSHTIIDNAHEWASVQSEGWHADTVTRASVAVSILDHRSQSQLDMWEVCASPGAAFMSLRLHAVRLMF